MNDSPEKILSGLKDRKNLRVLGLMSGTSMDGLDLCYTTISLDKNKLDYHIHWTETVPYPKNLRNDIRHSVQNNGAGVGALHHRLGQWYANVIEERIMKRGSPRIDLIGSHGQTIHHHHGVSSLQIGEPAYLVATLHTPVIYDFRSNDIAAGGSGAPLVPWIDKRLFYSSRENRICVNIGGIGNITVIPSASPEIRGCDTGPGMALLDEMWQRAGKGAYDKNGNMAWQGNADMRLVADWLRADEFIRAKPPKSTGRDRYGSSWIKKHRQPLDQLPLPDALATLSAFTAQAILIQCRNALKDAPFHLIISGGGAHHKAIIDYLRRGLDGLPVSLCSSFGIDVDGKEAFAFAVLAVAFVKGIPANVPGITGAKKEVILGKLCL